MKNLTKKTTEKSVANIVIFSAVVFLITVFCVLLFAFNANYCKVYKSPEVKNGKVDFTGVDLYPRDVACNLSGEWEFYYNRWIITDGDDGESDGKINVPSLWTYKDYGNGKLSKTGYASYKLIAENVEVGANVVVFRHNENFAYRVFINGELNYVSGELSKDPNETEVTGVPKEIYPYVSDGNPLEIVIELSATTHGGLNAAPWLAAVESGVEYGDDLRAFTYIALGVSVTAVVISLLSVFFFATKKDFSLPLFSISMLIHFITSKDMMYVSDLSFTATSVLRLVSAIASFCFFILHLKREGAKYGKRLLYVGLISAIILAVLLVIFYGTPIAPIFALLLLILAAAYIYPLFFKSEFSVGRLIVYGALFELLITTFVFEFCDVLGLLKFGTEFIFSMALTFIILCFSILMLHKIANASRQALRAKALEKELAVLENKSLKAQIKPHFIFNSLTAIQHQYRKDLELGDDAVEKFARHLRFVTDAQGDLIPFEDEIRNLVNYFELENLRYDGRLNLLLNLEYVDFLVPPLSLQPLVENAVKHAGLLNVEDGFIEVCSSLLDDGNVLVTVTDNGKGFQTENAKEGVGLYNVKRRFSLLGADVKIKTALGEGVKIEIRINKNYENNRS